MNVRPLHDRVLVKRVEEKEVVKGGIIIPDTAKEKPMEGEVIAVGPGKITDDGKVKASVLDNAKKRNKFVLTRRHCSF